MIRKMMGKRVLFSLLLAFILAVLCACGSGGAGKEAGNRPPAAEKETADRGKETSSDVEPLGEVNTIPEDGIITKEQFATVAGEDKEISFVGETDDGIKYTWVYHAAQIRNPEDRNLKIAFETENLDEVKKDANNANDALKMTMQGGGLICPPTLTVVIPQAWQSDTGLLLKEQDAKLAKMSDVTIVSQPAQKKDRGEGSTEKSTESSTETAAGTEALTEPVEGTTTLTMTVLSLDGDSYIVGGITDPDKLAAINSQMQTVASANANQGYAGETVPEGNDQGGSGYSGGSGNSSGNSGSSGSGKSQKGKSGKSGGGAGAGGYAVLPVPGLDEGPGGAGRPDGRCGTAGKRENGPAGSFPDPVPPDRPLRPRLPERRQRGGHGPGKGGGPMAGAPDPFRPVRADGGPGSGFPASDGR